MTDPRKEYIVQCIISVLNIPRNEFRSNTTSNTALEKFLDHPNEKILQAIENDSGDTSKRTVTFQLGFSSYAEGLPEMHFVKTSYEPLTEANISRLVMVSSLRMSAVRSLYYNVHEVYMPLLVETKEGTDGLEGRLTDSLVELDAGLKASLRRGLRSRNAGEFDDNDMSGIVTPVDEVHFWEELKNATGVGDAAVDRASKFSDALAPIASDLDDLTKKTFPQLLELVETLMDSLDSLWQCDVTPQYPAARMLHFLKVIAGALGRCVQSRLNSLNVWTSSFSQVSKHIREGHKVCERWNEVTVDLTDVQWRSSDNRWEGEAYKDPFLTNLAGRIQEVSQLRGQHDQILKLLSEDELKAMQIESCFEPFLKLSAFSYNDYTVPAWRTALAEYEARMAPVEAQVAERLRAELFTNTSNPAQTVRVFQRYQDLLERRNIRQSLTNERERLLTELDDFLGRVQAELETFDSGNLPAGRGLSLHARKMVWVEQLRSKADLAARPLAGFLKDLHSAGKVGNTYKKVRAELKEFRNRAYKDWCDEVESQLKDPEDPIALEMNSRVMDFDTAQQGALKITYSERLIELVKEARIFEQLGCNVPNKVKLAVQDGLKFYRFAVQLKQVCNFYNTLSAELLPSQKLMVLQPALAFEQLFNEKSGMKKVQWNKFDQLETFTRSVKDGAERLRAVNRRLRNGHTQVSQEVVQLANISLLRQRDQWKQKLAQIQKAIDATIGACGCQIPDAKPWKAHWDFQIFKIMEVQYRFGLESLNENLPEMKADLILAQKQLKLKPPLEELKSLYFKEIKSFISLPLQFKGLDGAPHVYKAMPDRNAEGIAVVFQKADGLFQRVQQLQNSFSPWLVVGLMPERVQELVEELTDPKDWDLNFRAIKAKRKEMDKIPDTVKIDCFTISTVVLKSVIEDQLERLSDALVIALRRKASDEAKSVMQFLEQALEKLNVRPDTVQELGKAQADAAILMEEQSSWKKQLDQAEEKNKLLKTVGTGIDMSEVQNKWEDFLIRLEAFEQLANDLREELRGKMDQRIAQMNSDIDKFASRWQSLKPKTADDCSIEEAKKNAQQMQEWQSEWQALREQMTVLQGDCADFGLPAPELQNITDVEEDLNRQQASWSLFEEFTTQYEELLLQTWLELRPRLFSLQDLAHNWLARLREVPRDPVTHMLSQQVQRLNAAHPALKAMTGEPFEKDHWKILFGLLKLPADTKLEALTFRVLAERLDIIVEKVDELKELTARAIGEVTIRDAVMEVSAWFEQAEFNFMDHAVRGGFVPLIKDWKDLMSEVSEKQNLCGSLKDSRFFGPFKDQVDKFEEKLTLLDELLLCMNKVQRKWVYLEPIFGRGSLPREKERFDKVNGQYRQIMKNVGAAKKVNYLCTVRGLKEQFVTLSDQLERCQKALNSFLEEKRSAFPRLYFIGDEDLLEILGQSSNPEVIQAHLKKLFAGIATVDFDPNITRIVAMNSSLKENVPLGNAVVVREGEDPLPVEEWLSNLSNEMFSTLAVQLQGCYAQSEMDMQQFEKYPSQLLCLSANIHFTHNIERYMSNGQLLQLKGDLQSQLTSMTSLSLDGALPQAKLKALILDLIHNISVLEDLLVHKVQKVSEWSWYRQLRYYLKQGAGPEHKPCSVRMLECEQSYSFEYQGNAPKLVHTPLTDKCYLTLMHGLHLGYGGNPYGPAGTGKTESVKALGSCLGRQVLVFNCDEGIDFQAMGRIFVGLVRCGAWGCFDEFNRLLEEQMSAISQSVQLIQAAIKNSHSTVHLLNRDVPVNHNAGIFITLNPATKGYGGRQKLPDNLKQLFRPVAMSVPDNELIAEVMMFAEGFMSAKVLAQKIVALFLLSRQLLSSQQHYDWGLRALKPILTLAGRLLQETKAEQAEPLREDEESVILLKAVRMNTLSKLTFADSKRFQDLCVDLFPGINVKDIEYKELEAVIRETMREMRLAEIDSQIYKMLQFHEACQQRMGVGIVGPSGCGKSTIWKVLEAAYKKQGKKYVVHVMNPKSMHRIRLLGHMDHDTREWFDGVLTASARKVIKEPSTTHNWIVCDGDIDPEWIESLNSVLDDNKLLTMPNGERIQFGSNVNFVFETDHLRFASPATISRLTMIFLSEEDVDVKPLVTSWILKQPEEQQGQLESWFDELFYRALDWLYKGSREMAIETTRMGMVSNVLGHLSKAEGEAAVTVHDESPGISKQSFLLAICRGLGGNLSEDDRAALTREAFKWSNENIPDPSQPLHCQVVESLIVGYQVSAGTEISLEDVKRAAVLPPLVPTATVLRNMDLFSTWLAQEQPFLVSGPEGAGKNLLIRHAIHRLQNESDAALNVAVLNCNAQTSSKDVLQKLRQFCAISTGTTGRIYRPREGRRLVLYLKDINLPTPDKYDTSEIIMFLQQAVMHKGFYDDDLEFVLLEHIQIVASIAPASTLGRHRLATRFTANVRVCSISYPSSEELVEVYTHFLRATFTSPDWQNVSDRSHGLCEKLAEAMVDIYASMKAKFTMDDHEHYLFNPRDLTQWVLQLLRYEVMSVESLVEAWAYEATRIFRDRLVGDEAKSHFDALLRNALIQYVGVDVEVDKLMFTAMLTLNDEGVPSGDMKKVSPEDYTKMVKDGLKSYQREVKDLEIELVPEVLEQLSWMDRALAAPVANDLLVVGRSGGGKRSVISLLAHMHRLALFSPAPARRYGDKEWKRDLKAVMQMTGVEKQHTILFLEDHHLLKSEFLESINSLLSAGDVPGIWTPEELEPLLAPLKEEWAASQGRGGGARTPFEYFCNQVQQRLHIVLSMDPNHPHFLPYCAANPALFSCTTVLWLDEWSEQSKTIIAQRILGEMLSQKNLGSLLQDIHASQAKASPRHYITLLQTCHAMYSKKISTASGQSSHLQKGLSKLQEVSQTVERLQEDAIAKQKVLEEKKVLAAEALQRITAAMQQSADRRQEVERLEGQTQLEQEKNSADKASIEKELSEIQPILDAAKKAVGSIKPEHLNEIRALKMPPDPIHDVLNGVLRLMGNYDNSWASMKKFLAGTGAIQRIINFDPRQIDEKTRSDVEKLLREKSNSFDHATIYRVSVAAAPLAKWVVACVRYSTVLVKVAPMEKARDDAEESLRAAHNKLAIYKEELVQIDEDVQRLQEEFAARTREAEALRVDLERATSTLEKADHLMSKMSGEKDRWESQVAEIQRDAALLSTHTCLSAAYCTYLGHFSEDVRQQANFLWTESRGITTFDFLRMMSSESELLTWKAQGLSADRLSQENAVMINSGILVPFIVDPNSQALEWLRQTNPHAESVLQQDPKLVSQLELAVRFGKVLIIQEVDGIDNYLVPLLRRDMIRQGPRQAVQISDKMCDFDENFRLFLCTRNSSAIEMLPPNTACLVTRVNFTVTRAGLEGQLLGVTLQHEKPELEHRKSELLQKEEALKVELSGLEKTLLEQLADSSGNILENEPLIQSLEQTKAAAITISESLTESSRLQMDLDQQREVYRPLATLGSRIFILVKELSVIDHMYRFSLEAFMALFNKVLNLQLGSETTDDKLRQLGNQLKIVVLFYISRSLFKADRLTFGIHMVRGIMPEKFEANEWELFQGVYIPANQPPAPAPGWCPQDRAQALQTLRATFPKIDEHWQLNKDALWAPWVKGPVCGGAAVQEAGVAQAQKKRQEGYTEFSASVFCVAPPSFSM
ncbi:DYH1B [Symbiodinium sp. CCMP2456]|nr:DYH1B [Symbiodinium sp. CCMP2456]